MSDGHPPEGDFELRRVGRELSEELRSEAEAIERDAATAARRRRSLSRVARDLMARGDLVEVVVPRARVTGRVVHAAGDLVSLSTSRGRVDVPTTGAVTLRVVEAARGGGLATRPGPASFRARLRELEVLGAEVELGLVGEAVTRRGVVAVVARDHLALSTDEGELLVAVAGITHVLERSGVS